MARLVSVHRQPSTIYYLSAGGISNPPADSAMKLFLLGATGRTGRHVLELALERGHTVQALVRFPEKVAAAPHPNLRLFTGTPTDAEAAAQAMAGCEVVISTLNIARTSEFPWSPLRTPEDFLSQSLHNIIAGMRRHGLRRLVLTSAWGAGETAADIPGWFRWFIQNSNIGPAYRDHERQEALLLKTTDLDWTAVRPAGLVNTKKLDPPRVSFGGKPKPALTIGRRQLAKFLVDIAEDGRYVREMPVVSGAISL